MAIYTGFFDAAFDEATGTYDREYGSADFTGYFGQIVGSGVCVHGNDDSMRVYYDAASKRAVVNPGYLFIRGYWLKNDGLYTVDLADLPAGVYALRAALNLGTRSITIGQVPKATPEEYPDALVLAYATVAEGGVTVEDTRSRTDICGLIDAAGSLSVKVDYAIHYIDNEINGKLDQIQQSLQAQEAEIDGKIAEANGLIAKIAPPAVGTIKFSASQDIEEGWLRCDGKFINEADYPELVAALGKNYPSGDKFQLLNTEGVGIQISNGVVCEGRLWVFSYADRKLYGIDLEGNTAPKIVELTSDDPNFSGWQNPNSNFLALSIIPNLTAGKGYRVFVAQANQNENNTEWDATKTLVFSSDFSGEESVLNLSLPFTTEKLSSKSIADVDSAIPYVMSRIENGIETFYCLLYAKREAKITQDNDFFAHSIIWSVDDKSAILKNESMGDYVTVQSGETNYCYISGYSPHNLNEFTFINSGNYVSTGNRIFSQGIRSFPEGVFDRDDTDTAPEKSFDTTTTAVVAGDTVVLGQLSANMDKANIISRTSISALKTVPIAIQFPSGARPFIDGCTYLWGKKMFMIFVGTGILFSRDLSEGSFGYLDTTSVLGTITQYASIRYSQDEGTLYIVGQDTTNTIRAAKIILNTLYDYASDGAWLPLIASDGIPAYIKAIGEPPPPPPPAPTLFKTLTSLEKTDPGLPGLLSVFDVNLNGEPVKYGSNVEYPSTPIPMELVARQDYTNPLNNEIDFNVRFDNTYESTFSTRLGGTVLPVGGSVKKGDTTTFMVNMKGLKETHTDSFGEYAFRFTSTNTAGKGG